MAGKLLKFTGAQETRSMEDFQVGLKMENISSIGINFFFDLQARARCQRSQSPVLGTSIIYKYFGLYKKLKTKRKIKEFPISLSSDGANEQIPFDSPTGRKERGKLYNPATQFGHHTWL